eukprot:m.80339 g.80339  ORF g.80339 m.80339 type:complete len:539 (+) comp19372_c0_seq1:247-1863(+)
MVLLSASICTKTGKALVGRNFMEVSRSRIEGLLAAFPKLIDTEGQHTFVETDTVRYVYQPMENLYMVLITTKNSNILEDLETLRLFARVVPDCCPEMSAEQVTESAFELIFAFDEIVGLGYREDVNIQQIRTYIEMESHDENIAKMVKKSKEAEQREYAKRVAKDLSLQKRQRERMGLGSGMGGMGSNSGGMGSGGGGGGMGGMGSGSMGGRSGGGDGGGFGAPVETAASSAPAPSRGRAKRGGLKLGNKGKKDNAFADKLLAEGQSVMGADQAVAQDNASALSANRTSAASEVPKEPFHVRVTEEICVDANKDGGLESMVVSGFIYVHVSDPAYIGAVITIEFSDDKKIPFQPHPNVDKKRFNASREIALKGNKTYKLNDDLCVVRYRYTTSEADEIPFTINCWPNINRDGTCNVNVEYELVDASLTLEDVVISIPVPDAPVVDTVEQGDYHFDRREAMLTWNIPSVAEDSATASMEFSTKRADSVDDFFPTSLTFRCSTSFAGAKVKSVSNADGGEVPYSTETILTEDQEGGYKYV